MSFWSKICQTEGSRQHCSPNPRATRSPAAPRRRRDGIRGRPGSGLAERGHGHAVREAAPPGLAALAPNAAIKAHGKRGERREERRGAAASRGRGTGTASPLEAR